jgi:NAD(P)H-dependent flavin oxidoreductase YrpB (nitropropane dioxygenase family)
MGTRFLATVEAPIHDNVKKAIVEASETDTVLVMRSMRNTERVFKNKAAEEVARIEKEHPGDFSKIKHLIGGKIYKDVFHNTGDIDGEWDFCVRACVAWLWVWWQADTC